MTTLLTSLDARGVASIALNRPEVHNAFDDAVIAELNAAIDSFARHPDVRLLVLRAEGKSFSAGADLGWMKRMASYSREDNLADARELERLMRGLYGFPKPTLAVVQGAAYGGAVGLVSCCDIVIASESASFALSEVKLGLAPAVISPFVIAAMGARQAGRYFLTAERFSAVTARDLGLVHEVVAHDSLQASCDGMVDTLLANGPVALMVCKSLLRHVSSATSPELAAYTTELIASLRTSQEGQEGLTAFFEKRQPAWQKKI
ncbi:MAG: gamma-carboxygeranoyl-CoA hydratase [Moraxellaceae bacterium]|jgi:methylglutaconyl-CoA hydratase|nr:gamma-carboxygeranoyl-CoA hydratase [Moraxellaceae bacterium]